MADWSKGQENKDYWGARPAQSSDPAGLTQAQGNWSQPDASAPSSARVGAVDWFGGRNLQAWGNAWGGDFYDRMIQQRNEQLDKAGRSGNPGDFYDWFQRRDATGVSSWDDPNRIIQAGRERRGIRVGDVFYGGKWTGNLYDDNKEEDADLLMSRVLFDGKEQSRLNTADNIPLAYRRAVSGRTSEMTQGAAHAEQAWETQEEVKRNIEEQKGWLGGAGDWLAAGLASGTGGAALGGIKGGPWGAAAGFVGGFVSGVMNQDQYTEAIARVRVQANRAGDQEGWFAAAAAQLQGIGQIGQMSLSPLQNTLSGGYDLLHGEAGDGVSEFYKVDTNTGERKASGAWQTAHVVSSIGDSFLQFGSGGGAAAYMGTMTASTLGKGLGLVATDSVWVDEYGDYHNLQGTGEHASAWAEFGIDALQLGVTGSFARATASLRGESSLVSEGVTGGLAEKAGDAAWRKLTKTELAPEGARAPEIRSGRKFFFNEDGTVHSSRLTMSAMVPSEMVRWIPATYMARYGAIRRGGGMTQDDVYDAALKMSGTGGRMADAMINAFGEGSEEMVQAVLDPMAYGSRPIGEQVYMAGAYGFAGGLGMSLGPMLSRPSSEQARKDYARTLETMRSGEAIPKSYWDERWAAMTPAEKNRAASANVQEAKSMQQWYDAIGERRRMEATGTGLVGVMAAQAMAPKTQEDMLKAVNPAVDAALQMHIIPNTMVKTRGVKDETPRYPVNAGMMTSFRLLNMYQNKLRMMKVALAQTGNTDQEIQRWTAERDVLKMVTNWLKSQHNRLQNEENDKKFDERIEHINEVLLAAVRTGAWTDKDGNVLPPESADAVRNAVELNLIRHPIIDAGSVFTVVPQVDTGWVRKNMHGSLGIGQAMQEVAQGDYDGDAPVSLQQADFRYGKRSTMRSGPQYASATDEVEIDESGTGRIVRKWNLNAGTPDNERDILNRVNSLLQYTGHIDASAIEASITYMRNNIAAMYAPLMEKTHTQADPMQEYLNAFEADIRAGNPKARKIFVEALLNHNGGQGYEKFMQLGQQTHRAEILELLQMITTGIDNISRDLNGIAFDARRIREIPLGDRDPIDEVNMKFLERVAVTQAATMAQMSQVTYGPDGTRTSGHMHYNPFVRAAVDLTLADPKTQVTDVEIELARAFMEASSGAAETDLEKVESKDITARRTRDWMREVATKLRAEHPDVLGDNSFEATEGMLVWGQLSAPDIEEVDGQASTTPRSPKGAEGRNSLLQLLLRKSVQIDEQRNMGAKPDHPIHAKLARLKGLTQTKGKHPTTPSLAANEVYGDMAVYDLVGDVGSHFIGASLTMNQVVQILAVMGNEARNQQTKMWKSNPLYIHGTGRGDPPYSLEDVQGGRINSFTVFVDMVTAIANTQHDVLKGRDKTTGSSIRTGLSALQRQLESLRDDSAEEVRAELELGVDQEVTLDHALEFSLRYPDLARVVAEAVAQKDSFLGTFKIEGNQVLTAKWVKEMLRVSKEDGGVNRAELMLLMEPLFDQFNVMGGTIDRANMDKGKDGKKAKPSSGVVNESRIDSRLLQLIHNLASMPSNKEIAEFLKVYENSKSVEEFLKVVNDNPVWLGNQPEFLPYHDSKRDFETDPRDVWSAGAGTERREVLNDFGKRVDLMTQQMRTSLQVGADNLHLISQFRELARAERAAREAKTEKDPQLRASLQKYSTPDQGAIAAKSLYEDLKLVQDRAKRIATTNGGKIREQFVDVAVEQVIAQQDKGSADERLKAAGEWLVLSSSEALAPGPMLESEKLTHLGIDSIRMNPDLLNRGKTRIMMKDGRVTEIDVTDMEQMLAGLADPGLNAVVWAAVFPTYRDINAQGILQLYQGFDSSTALSEAILNSKPLASIPDDLGAMTVDQADEIISMFEGHAKRASEQTMDADKRRLGFFPVQTLINDVALAYTSRPDYPTMSASQKQALNRKARIKVAQALLTVARVGSSSREFLKEALTAGLADRAQGGENEYLNRFLEQAFPNAMDRNSERIQLISILAQGLDEESAKYTKLLKDHDAADKGIEDAKARNDAKDEETWTRLRLSLPARAWVEEQWLSVEFHKDELGKGNLAPGNPTIQEFEAVARAFDVDVQDASKEALYRRGMLVDFLLDGTNFPGLGADKISQDLMRNLQYENTHNPDLRRGVSTRFGPAEWKQLAVIAAKRQIAVSTQRSGSGVLFLTNPSSEFADIRYWDRTFSYLASPLFNPALLDAADWLQGQVKMPRIDSVEAADLLMKGLFAEDDLGDWNPILPGVSMSVQKALDGASVGLTIPIGGSTPVSMFDTAVAQYSTWDAPVDSTHTTDLIVKGNALEAVEHWFDDDLMGVIKLHNHFAAAIDTTALVAQLTAMGVDPAAMNDIVRKVNNSLYNHPDPEVDTQGYKILDLMRLQDAMVRLHEAYGIEEFELGITYVDVGKKPFSPEYVNHGLFDGVGRLTQGSGAISPFAAMVFGVSGLSKILQQQPLDFAAKNGAAYTMYITSLLEDIEMMEKSAKSVEELMMLKAKHLYVREYEFGWLMRDDLTALYKLMKSRHVYWGKDPSGNERYMWAEEVISFERSNISGDWKSSDLDMIPLTDEIYRLLTGASAKQAGNVVTRPEFDIDAIDRFPLLTRERLEGLGLEDLGRHTPPERTELARFTRLSGVNTLDPRTAGTFRTSYADKVEAGLQDRSAKVQYRTQNNGTGPNKFDLTGISQDNLARTEKALDGQRLDNMFRKLGIPYSRLVNTTSERTALNILTGMDPTKVGDASVLWYFDYSNTGGWNKGILNQGDARGGFEGTDVMRQGGPTWGDLVTVDLTSILEAFKGDEDAAARFAGQTLRTLEKKGVTIILVAPGNPTFHGMVSKWVRAGGIDYVPVAGSRYVFEPTTEKNVRGKTLDALESTLTAVHTVRTDSATLVFDVPAGNLVSEAGAIALDASQFQAMQRRQITTVPTAVTLSLTNQEAGEFVFNMPRTHKEQTEALAKFSTLLNDPVEIDKLTARAAHGQEKGPKGKKKADPDPKDLAQYKERADGRYDPGIRAWPDALKKLRETIEAGKLPLYEGQQDVMAGDIVILRDLKGRYLLYRLGMKLPIGSDLKAMYADGSDVHVSLPRVEDQQTLPPPFTILSIDPDSKGKSVYAEWKLDPMGKAGLTGLGIKLTVNPMPADYQMPPEKMSGNPAGKGLALMTSTDSMEHKLGIQKRLNNFSVGFALSGIDFRRYLVNALMGKSYTSTQGDAFEKDWDTLRPFLKAWEKEWWGLNSTDIADLLRTNVLFTEAYIDFSKWADTIMTGLGQSFSIPDLTIPNSGNVDMDITRVFLAALAAPETKLEHIISTPGLLTVSNPFGDSGITFMPSLLTDALDNRTELPHVRAEMLAQINAPLPKFKQGKHAGKAMYFIDDNFNLTVALRNMNTGKYEDFTGRVSIVFPVHNTENPAAYAQSSLMKSRDGFTPHVANVLGLTLDARMILKEKKGPSPLDEMFGENDVIEFGADPGRTLAAMLGRVPDRTKSSVTWEGEQPLEMEGRRQALMSIGDFDYRVDKTTPEWAAVEDQRLKKYGQFLTKIGLSDETRSIERMVDKHIRMYLGAPGPFKDQKEWVEHVSPEAYMETLNHFVDMLGQYRNFMEGGAVPLPTPDLINVIYQAGTWAPVKKVGKNGQKELADKWEDWVTSFFGQMLDSQFTFDTLFSEDLDGVIQLWKDYTKRLGAFGLSLDQQRELMVKHRGTNSALLSINPLLQGSRDDPLILADAWNMGYDSLTGKDRYASSIAGRREAQISGLAQRRSEWAHWLAKKKAPKPAKHRTVKDYSRTGEYYIDNAARGSAFFRNLTNLSLGVRMFDLTIYASGYIEQPTRNMLEHMTNILTGNYTGPGARAFMKAAESKTGKKIHAAGQKVSEAIQLGTFEPMFTYQDLQIRNALAEKLGSDRLWLDTLYDEMAYHNLIRKGEGKVGGLIEKFATRTSRAISDPRFGSSQKAVAGRYIDAVIENIIMTGGTVNMTSLAKELSTNSMWLAAQYGDQPGLNPHLAGMQSVAQVRSAKQTPLSKVLMGRIDALTNSTNLGANFLGFLAKIPFMFTRFTANSLAFATGMEGWNQAGTMFFSGRKRPKWLGGNAQNPYWDMTDCLETMDLRRSMIRSGTTLTMVFTLGLLAGGKLGLDGEDEEEKRRRKMARYLNLPQILDPREPENSFTYADAIFLDSIPVLNTLFRDESGHSAIVPHWVLRQFTSPIIGMSRFFETGDAREIGYGFLDAFSALPNSVTRLFHEADLTAKMLIDQAEKDGVDDSAEGQMRSMSFLIQAFSVYEQALLENQFINTLYSGADKYDRNPWAVPMTDDQGNLVLQQGTGLPQQTEALQSYVDENGEVQQGYMTRKGLEGELYQYAENHAVFAALGALFTGNGFSSPLLRSNMAPRQRRITLPESSDERVMAAILALYEKGGGLETYTKEEIAYALKAEATANGIFWNDADIQADAQTVYESNQESMGALSFITPEANEVLTDYGADRVLDGIMKGSIQLGSPAMAGISMDQEQRDRVGVVMMQRLVQDGIDRGLPETTAKYRAKRFYWGDDDYPDIPGIREILYSDDIPASNVIKYNQLNTMYMMGPDGKPWATPFERKTLAQAFLPVSHRVAETVKDSTSLDEQGKIIDEILGFNTGLHGIERIIEGVPIKPNDELIEEGLDKGLEETLVPKSARTPWRSYSRGGYGGGGGGGGGYFQRMLPLPSGTAARLDDIQMINAATPYIRRARVERERVTSERGRLKQWQ